MSVASRFRFSATITALVIGATACGGSSDSTTGSEATTTTRTPAADDAPPVSTAEEPPTTTTVETEPEIPQIPVITPDDIPGLIVAWGQGTGDPLTLAQDIIGFPVAVSTPDGTSPHLISVDMTGDDLDADWLWQWSYQATTGQGAIAEIDIELDEMGPGAIELQQTYDPILAALGWTYSNTTGSDPSSGAGGPQSVNHVYVYDGERFPLGGAATTPKPLFVWADEELLFGEEIPGYQIDVGLGIEPDIVPVPILEALLRELPIPAGGRLVGMGIDTWHRSDDSFDAEEGTRWIEIDFEFTLLADTAETAHEIYSTGLDGMVFQPGDESFFDPGFIEFEEPTVSGDRWTQKLIALGRYPGQITVETDPDTGTVSSFVGITLEPNRELLSALPE